MRSLPLALSLLLATAPAAAQAPVDNPEMQRLFAADQALRVGGDPKRFSDPAFVQRMSKDDAARRARTRELLDRGLLTTGKDYFAAAFVFQHGSHPDDYLLAHSLAMAAMAKGNADARWIATATLDRYLQTIWQRQIYGTQYRSEAGSPATQEPYDRTLIPDSLRTALGVPVQAEQDRSRKAMEAR